MGSEMCIRDSYGCWNHAVPGAPLLCHQPLEMQIAHYSHLSVRRYTYPYTIFNGLSGKAVAKRPRARFSCCTMTTNLGETFREGEDSTLPGFRAPISTIHARRFGNGQYYENTSGLDVQAKWKSCTTPPTPATRGGSTRSPAMRTRPICSAVLPRRTTAARSPSPRCVRRSAMRSLSLIHI